MKKISIFALAALSVSSCGIFAVALAKQQPVETQAATGVDKSKFTKVTSIEVGKDYYLGIYDDDSDLFPFNIPGNSTANWSTFNNSTTECLPVSFEKVTGGYSMKMVYNSVTYYIGNNGQNWTRGTTSDGSYWVLQSDSTLKTGSGTYTIGRSSSTSIFVKLLTTKNYPFYLYSEGGSSSGGSDPETVTLDHITINGSMLTTTYNVGDSWSSYGYTATAYYSDGSNKSIAVPKFTFDPETVTSADLTSVTVTCSYTEGGVTKTASVVASGFTINQPTPTVTNQMEEAYNAALANTYGTSTSYNVIGKVIATYPSYYVIQSGDYGLTVYDTSSSKPSGVAVGKVVQLNTKVRCYKGLPQAYASDITSAEIIEDSSITATAKTFYTTTAINSASYNILANVSNIAFASAGSTVFGITTYNAKLNNYDIKIYVESSVASNEAFTKFANGSTINLKGAITYSGNSDHGLLITDISQVEVNKSDKDYAEDYATEFLSVDCSVNKANWSSLRIQFQSLSYNARLILINASVDDTVIGRCVERYDLVISKYGTSTYDNFMNRTISTYPQVSPISIDNSNVVTIVVIAGITSITAIGGFALTKKRKEF